MSFCKCKENREFEQIGSWDGCPLEGGSHTMFYVERCLVCGGIFGFPQANFDLALSEGTQATKQKLAEIAAENEPAVEADEQESAA